MFGQVKSVNALSELNISNSSVFRSGPTIHESKFEEPWARAEKLQRTGNYFEAVSLREQVLTELYELLEIEGRGYFPPMISNYWVSNFGHLGLLGHHIVARKIGIIPKGMRTIVDGPGNPNVNLLKVITQEDQLIHQPDGNRWSEIPSFWAISERLRTIKSNQGFIDINQLVEEVHRSRFEPLTLPDEYVDASLNRLLQININEETKFVALHIRESLNREDPRGQTFQNYTKSIEEIIKCGYTVLRIGDPSPNQQFTHEKFVDLSQLPNNGKELHAYALAKCEFMLGTQSGPSVIPRIFGKPALLTNMTEIATSVTTSSNHSIYLPKKWTRRSNNRPLSLIELFETKLAFAASDSDVLGNVGCLIHENTEDELLDATKEMIQSIQYNSQENSPYESGLYEILKDCNSVGFGKIAESYMDKNYEWFLGR